MINNNNNKPCLKERINITKQKKNEHKYSRAARKNNKNKKQKNNQSKNK